MGYRYPQPDNEHAFEQLCLRLYRKLWKNECLALYGKRGENQTGIDIYDPLCMKPVRVVQCKHHEPVKTILPSEILAEVGKAEKSVLPIEHFVIATTAKKSRLAQDTVVDLNLRSSKKFTVEIHFWEELCEHASSFNRITAELVIYGENFLAGAIPQTGNVSNGPDVSTGSIFDGEEPFATIEKLLNERRLDLARHELQKVTSADVTNSASPDAMYKLLRLRGKLMLENGEYEAASNLFLEAYSAAPHLDQAKQNQVLAYSIVGERTKAYEYARKYVADGIRSSVMMLRLVDCIPSIEELCAHEPLITEAAESDVDVNCALSHKYLEFGDTDHAYAAAKQALQIDPDSPHAHFAAALSRHKASQFLDPGQRSEFLTLALGHYDSALDGAKEQRFAALLPEIYVNRAAARMLLSNHTDAEADYRAAVASASRPAVYVERAVGYFLQHRDIRTAREFVSLLDRSSLEARYLMLVIEYHTAKPSEQRKCIHEMSRLADEHWDRAVECTIQCVQWALAIGDHNYANAFVTSEILETHPFQAQTMRAWIRLSARDETRAREHASMALNESIKAAHPHELRLLADILCKLKDDAAALGLLERVAMPGIFNDDTKSLLACAGRLERHDILLRICRELRTAGTQDDSLKRLELQLLNRYDPKEAFRISEEFVGNSETPSYFTAFRNMLAVRLKQFDKLNLVPSALPTPDELPPSDVNLILLPYIVTEKYSDAVQYLYTQRRLHFEDEHAQGRYIFFFLNYGAHSGLALVPSQVGNDCAVLIQTTTGEVRWICFEDQNPVPSRGEFHTNSNLGEVLIGRKVGDVVELPGNQVQPQSATIQEIQSKYVRALQDGMQNFGQRFPGSNILQQVQLGGDEGLVPAAIIENLKGRRDFVQNSIELYKDHPCSLFLFADRVGINEFEAIQALSEIPDGVVKCCQTTPDAFELAASEGITAESVVLTISAIVTLTLTDSWQYLVKQTKYLVSQLTSELIDQWNQEFNEKSDRKGRVVGVNDQNELEFRENTEEELASNRSQLRQMKEMVERYCGTASSLTTAGMNPETRHLYEELLGPHNLEAINVAADIRAALWCDDHVVSFVARAELGVTTLWTQLAFRRFADSKLIPMSSFDLVSANLCSLNYGNCIWNPSTIIAAGHQAGWDPNVRLFARCIQLIAKSGLPAPENARIVLECIKRLRRSDCVALKQGAVIQALLNAFSNRRTLRRIVRELDQIFGVDIPSAEFVRTEIEYWLINH